MTPSDPSPEAMERARAIVFGASVESIARAIDAAVAEAVAKERIEERERCARICEEAGKGAMRTLGIMGSAALAGLDGAARAIREGSKP